MHLSSDCARARSPRTGTRYILLSTAPTVLALNHDEWTDDDTQEWSCPGRRVVVKLKEPGYEKRLAHLAVPFPRPCDFVFSHEATPGCHQENDSGN